MIKERIDCFKCRYFYVTWDQNFPKGCKAMGFKSKDMPYVVVEQASGMECMKFDGKGVMDKAADG
ncbi:MAG: uracil-DNA glycosylase [Nitrospirae bacterium]|nr:uracil-DNA glycosylase [Nitrospirota bacterium]